MNIKHLSLLSKPYGFDNKEINRICKDFNIEIPQYFISFIKEYGGASTDEFIYNEKFLVNFFLPLQSDKNSSICKGVQVYKQRYGVLEWIPFAIDNGGWTFCIALKENIKNQIWIDRYISGDLPIFDYVAPSFGDFINALKTEDE